MPASGLIADEPVTIEDPPPSCVSVAHAASIASIAAAANTSPAFVFMMVSSPLPNLVENPPQAEAPCAEMEL
jgi:hypothetical protein